MESDLLHICGAPTVTVDGKGTEQYELGFQPLQAGIVTGCVMFKDPSTGQYAAARPTAKQPSYPLAKRPPSSAASVGVMAVSESVGVMAVSGVSGDTFGTPSMKLGRGARYTWYTVELHVAPPKPQQALTLQCVVRQAVAMDIELTNPLDDVPKGPRTQRDHARHGRQERDPASGAQIDF